ncbi:MAG: HNH endonuclease family protein, partial [Clostridiales bacterium]|nr:HNH endonuclease family protein [Clostridiales bacterium]
PSAGNSEALQLSAPQKNRQKYLHTLGNLTLTAYNSELGDKPFDVKQQELDDVKTKVVVLYADVKGRTVWNADAIEQRAERLADAIVSYIRLNYLRRPSLLLILAIRNILAKILTPLHIKHPTITFFRVNVLIQPTLPKCSALW